MTAQRAYEIAGIPDRDRTFRGRRSPGRGDPAVVAVTSMDYQAFFTSALDRLKSERRYRVFADIERVIGRFPRAVWHSPDGPRDIIVWCSNDYLGMGQHSQIVGAMVETAQRTGVGRRRDAQYLRHEPRCRRTRSGTRRPPWQGSGARLHVGLCLEPGRHRHHRQSHPELPDLLGCRQSQFDDRGREAVRLREGDLPAQRRRPSRGTPPGGGRKAEAHRVRERLFHGRRHAPGCRDLRPRRAVWRDDLSRRGTRGRNVWSPWRRHRRARWRHGPGRCDRGNSGQGFRRARRLCRRLACRRRCPAQLRPRLHLHDRLAATRRRRRRRVRASPQVVAGRAPEPAAPSDNAPRQRWPGPGCPFSTRRRISFR